MTSWWRVPARSDVNCTWDMLLGRSNEKLRTNPRKTWYQNLAEVTTDGDYAATFQLKRPQPAFPALLASGFSPVMTVAAAAAVLALPAPWVSGALTSRK